MWVLEHPEAAAAVCFLVLGLAAVAALGLPRRRPRTTGETISFERKQVGL